MRREMFSLWIIVALILLCGCGGSTGTLTEETPEIESSEPAPEVAPPDIAVDPDRRPPAQPESEQVKPEDASAPALEGKSSTLEKQTEGKQQPEAGLSQMRTELDATIAELKTAIFEDRDAFAGQGIALKLADLLERVSAADSQDPILFQIIASVKENYVEVVKYLQAQHISGAQQSFTEMEKYYQEWKARMK